MVTCPLFRYVVITSSNRQGISLGKKTNQKKKNSEGAHSNCQSHSFCWLRENKTKQNKSSGKIPTKLYSFPASRNTGTGIYTEAEFNEVVYTISYHWLISSSMEMPFSRVLLTNSGGHLTKPYTMMKNALRAIVCTGLLRGITSSNLWYTVSMNLKSRSNLNVQSARTQ